MADFTFVIEICGFQHGSQPFYLKKIAIASVNGGKVQTFQFDTRFLRNHVEAALYTYRFQTENIHGIFVDEPGIPYGVRYDAVQTALKHAILSSQNHRPPHFPENPRILVLAKGAQNRTVVEELLPRGGILANVTVEDLSNYGCPSVSAWLGKKPNVNIAATLYAGWVNGRYGTAFFESLHPEADEEVDTTSE